DQQPTRSTDPGLAAGEYLPGITSAWVDAERQRYTALGTDLRLQAAELTFANGDFRRAADLVQPVLDEDPYREAAWRLSMRLADATGDPDGVIAAFRSCEDALRELGICPSETTRRLVTDLRR
ncbi:MAG: bacterial transcriptional activator domain-containing protein, partial [Sciscionella sp.]